MLGLWFPIALKQHIQYLFLPRSLSKQNITYGVVTGRTDACPRVRTLPSQYGFFNQQRYHCTHFQWLFFYREIKSPDNQQRKNDTDRAVRDRNGIQIPFYSFLMKFHFRLRYIIKEFLRREIFL